MATAPYTPSLSEPDEEVQFMGFGDARNSSNTTLPDCEPNKEGTEMDTDVEGDISDSETHSDHVPAVTCSPLEVLNDLAAQINAGCLSKFNIAKFHVGREPREQCPVKHSRQLTRYLLSFTDDSGTSEGAIDWGGPMREFFTLILQYIHDSQLMCGPENSRFLSYKCKVFRR
ncbi:hypothetical protein OS493_036276 [Desmophyllum pertusum]|uniref:HECT domain-containing protein n=1 Tax=Desmophyllum pertusum TaxID=174260 RepID=A0A9X0D035_9CNID|nr:hypothetical protein OS493_036276 [Desmophyllum pertusum]